MPITFAQPDPMSPEIQSAAGATEQWSKDLPSLTRLYEQAMQGQTQASIASAHNATQMNAAQLGASGHDSQSANALYEHAREFNQSQQVSQRDAFHAQVQQQQMQEQAQLHAWLNQQQLSQAESMKLQRMQNAVGEVMADPNLSDEEKTNLAMQLKTGIDPLRQRVEMQKAKLEEEMVGKAHHAAAQQQAWEDGNDEQRAKMFQAKTFTFAEEDGQPIMNPETGKPQKFFLNKDGVPLRFPQDATAGKDKGSEGKGAEVLMDRVTKYEQHAMDMAIKQRKADLDAWELKREATMRSPDEKKRIDPGPMPGDTSIATYMKNFLDEMPGYADMRAALSNRGGRGQNQPGQTSPQPDQPSGGPPETPAAFGPPEPPLSAFDKSESKPFDYHDPKGLTEVQKSQLSKWDAAISDLQGRDDLPKHSALTAIQGIRRTKQLLSQYGWLMNVDGKWNPKITQEDREYIEWARNEAKAIPVKGRFVAGSAQDSASP